MDNKVVVVLVDGMRPDGFVKTGNPFVENVKQNFTYTFQARTVMPSVTLPCHMSLFHSVEPGRHGITTNTYVPQVRPVKGMADVIGDAGLNACFFYTWEELRDLSRPDSLTYALCINQHKQEDTDRKITEEAVKYIRENTPDFSFIYLGETDERGGHDTGWMSDTYIKVVDNAVSCIDRIYHELPEGYTLIVLADHGGHDRGHGTDCDEDMTIPVLISGPAFAKGVELDCPVSILDVAPTVIKLLGLRQPREWEGKSLI